MENSQLEYERLAAEAKALDRVRRRVLAIGYFVVTSNCVFALIGVAKIIQDQGRTDDAMILLLMSGVVALLTYAGVRLLLGHKFWSPAWILFSLAPTIVSMFWLN